MRAEAVNLSTEFSLWKQMYGFEGGRRELVQWDGGGRALDGWS
jgi:hypothetical protein